jgi:head-tail adaptor
MAGKLKINAGQLRHKIFINYNATPDATDANGVSQPTWQPLVVDGNGNPLPIMALKEGIKGRLYFQAAAVQSESDIQYTIRFRTDVKATMQIVDDTETLIIKVPPVDPDGYRMWLEIHARDVMANG